VIEFREPSRTGFELRWSMFGVRFRVLPSFFIIAALLAYVFVRLDVVAMAVDVACIFIAIAFTELVQGLVYRSYGLRSTVIIQEFGGGIYPEREPPTVLQRIAVALASPASSFLLYAIVFYSNKEYHWAAAVPYGNFAYQILYIVTAFWGIIGLLPILPYPGGRVMLEVLTAISPRNGLVATLTISIVVGLAYIAYVAAVLLGHMREVPLVENFVLPASIIIAVFFALAVMHNWQMLRYARSMRRGQDDPVDDYGDHAPWER